MNFSCFIKVGNSVWASSNSEVDDLFAVTWRKEFASDGS